MRTVPKSIHTRRGTIQNDVHILHKMLIGVERLLLHTEDGNALGKIVEVTEQLFALGTDDAPGFFQFPILCRHASRHVAQVAGRKMQVVIVNQPTVSGAHKTAQSRHRLAEPA